jgi:hypothetical protein
MTWDRAQSSRSLTPRPSTIPAGSGRPRPWGGAFRVDPKKYQSGETDVTGRISKIGDGGVRTALYEAANVILTPPVKSSTLKSWGMRLAARTGMRKAKVALARKLGRGSAPHAGRRDELPRRQSGCGRSPLTKGDCRFGRFETPVARSKVPSPGRWIRSDR